MAQELRTAFRESEEAFSRCVELNDCVIVTYCTHISVWTIAGIFIVELEY